MFQNHNIRILSSKWIISKLCLVSYILLIGLFLQLIPASLAAQEQARMSDSFVESVGINIKLSYYDQPYGQFDSVKKMLVQAGIRYYRDGFATSNDLLKKQVSLANAGIKLLPIIHPDMYKSKTNDLGQGLNYLVSQYSDVKNILIGIENPNETDGRPITYKGLSHPQSIIKYSNDLDSCVKNSIWSYLPVLAPSYSNPWNYGDLQGCVGDINNIHPYQGGRMPENTEEGQSLPFYTKRIDNINPGKKVWVTETGNYTTAKPDLVHIWFSNTTELIQAKYMLRTYLTFYKAGIEKTFVHMLVDYYNQPDWCEARFGICRSDWSPKPAYTALKNLIGLLNDPGMEFTTEKLNYSIITKYPTVDHLLFQNRQGVFFLVLWNKIQSWNYSVAKELTISPVPVSLVFEKAPSQMKIYEPLYSANPNADYNDLDSLNIKISDHPVIIRIETGNTSGSSHFYRDENSFRIFPNPSVSGIVNIQFPESKSNESFIVKIYNMDGKQLISNILNKDKHWIVTDGLVPGIYLVTVQNDRYTYKEKIIIN